VRVQLGVRGENKVAILHIERDPFSLSTPPQLLVQCKSCSLDSHSCLCDASAAARKAMDRCKWVRSALIRMWECDGQHKEGSLDGLAGEQSWLMSWPIPSPVQPEPEPGGWEGGWR